MARRDQRLPLGLSMALARFMREPTVDRVARELVGGLIERIPLPICLVREPALEILVDNEAFRSLATHRRTLVGCLGNDDLAQRLSRGVVESICTGTFQKHPVQSGTYAKRKPSERCYEWLFCPLFVFSDTAGFVAIVGYDVTPHVEAQERTRDALHHTEHARAAKEELFAQLAHELRSPLAPIVSALELLRQSPCGKHDRPTLVLERQARHLARLIEDVSDLSRNNVRGLGLARERVAFAAVVDRALELSSPLFDTHRQSVRVDIERDLVVDGDMGRLVQVMSNLLTNASKYTSERGTIHITARRVNGEVVASVADSGIGIARDMLPRVFERFVQAPEAMPRRNGGVGLGLHIARMLVSAHGGSIEVDSDGPGRGSTFTVRLPSMERDASAPDCGAEPRERVGRAG